ncbi:MAG: alpha/beta fold hydrolase [Pseudomonadaceae bacterium]|nr:alpha/beta fold hydrolase [Pseudomonadaceae bacterium]
MVQLVKSAEAHRLVLLACLLGLASPTTVLGADVAEPPPPIEAFVTLPLVRDVKLSPDGNRYAAIVTSGGRSDLVIQSITATGSSVRSDSVRIDVSDRFLVDHEWASNERLLFRTRALESVLGRSVQHIVLSSVNRWGGDRIDFHQNHNELGITRLTTSLLSRIKHEPDHVLAVLDNEPAATNWGLPRVHRINVVTGERQLIQRNRLGITQWLADARGDVRLGIRVPTGSKSLDTRIYYRPAIDRDWVILQDVGYFDRKRLLPVRFHPNLRNVLLVTTGELIDEAVTSDKPFLFAFDLAEKVLLGPYEDMVYAKAMELFGRAYPGHRIEVISSDDSGRRVVARISSSTATPAYVLGDLEQGSVGVLAHTYSALADWPLAPMRRIDYSARDGLNIPAFLTLPLMSTPGEPLPLVVLVHGGPWARDYPGFDNIVQLLASRGYAVLQPQYRGSTGFGTAHLEAGYRQWGLAISDDIDDGVLAMIERGQIDPRRVCIAGASFGGYAAAIALAKSPELYRCGISINGVLDLKALINDAWSMNFFGINRAVWNDSRDVSRTSPLARANDIRAPLLLIAGTDDTVVPIKHSRRLARRLHRLGRPVELLELEGGEHWRSNSAVELTKFSAVDAFLAKHLAAEPVE